MVCDAIEKIGEYIILRDWDCESGVVVGIAGLGLALRWRGIAGCQTSMCITLVMMRRSRDCHLKDVDSCPQK